MLKVDKVKVTIKFLLQYDNMNFISNAYNVNFRSGTQIIINI